MIIIKKDAINNKDEYGFTQLHYEVHHPFKCNLQNIKILIDNGIDVNSETDLKCIALHFAIMNNHTKACKMLIDNNSDINKKNIFGNAPIHLAAFFNQAEVVNMLIEKGADIYLKDDYGYTALDVAEEQENQEIVSLLEKAMEK